MWRAKLTVISLIIAGTTVCASDSSLLNDNLPPRSGDIARNFIQVVSHTQAPKKPITPRPDTILNMAPQPPDIPPVPDDETGAVPETRTFSSSEKPQTPAPPLERTEPVLKPSRALDAPVTSNGAAEPLITDSYDSFDAYEPFDMPSAQSSTCCPQTRYYQSCVGDELCRVVTGYVGATFMTRSASDPRTLFVNAGRPNERIDAADYDFGVQSGVEAGLTLHGVFNEVVDLDLRFLNVGDVSDTQRTRFTGNGALILTPTQFSIPGSRSARTEYASSMNSFEANFRYRHGGGARWLTLLAGFRYLNVSESLTGQFVAPGGAVVDRAAIDVDNHLYGFQIGADKTLFGDCSYNIDVYGRAGIYGNDSSSGTELQNSTPGMATFRTSGHGGQSSFVGELGVKGTVRITEAWNFYGRYQVIAVDDIAVASQQFNNQHMAQGEVVFHGASFGIEYIY